jgi:hypothetical protein
MPELPLGSNQESRTARRRWKLVTVTAALVLFICGCLVAFRIAVESLKSHIVEGLGPGSAIKELNVRWSSLELVGISLDAPSGWPVARTLTAERVTIVPSLRSLLTKELVIASITVENPYLSVLRVPGKLLIIPTILETVQQRKAARKNADPTSRRDVVISKIVLSNASMEVFDATVSRPAHKIRLEGIEAIVRDIATANPQQKIGFELAGVANGKVHDGRLKVSGWVASAGRDSSSLVILQNVDLTSLQPYLLKGGEGRVSKGSLDLTLKSEVRNHKLNGTGKMTIKDLEFAQTDSYLATFMGIPRNMVIGFLKDHENTIHVDFTLGGDIRHPNFSLNQTLASRIATGMAGQLGVSIAGMAEGLETLGRKGLEGVSGAATAVGSVVRDLFSGSRP